MAQIASRGGGTPFGPGVVTVAELVSRIAPASVDPRPATTAISVGSLLRREGRAPHALDRPLQPRARDVGAAGSDGTEQTGDRRVLVRRSAYAAGALLAAGSVFGAAVVTDATSSQSPLGSGSYPGQGALDDAPAAAAVAPTVALGPAAQSSRLDSGIPAPTSWMDVAFPAAAPVPVPAPVQGAAPAATATTRAPTGGTAASTPKPAGTGSGATPAAPAPPAAGGSSADSVTGRVGGTVSGLGTGSPVQAVTDTAGGLVTGLGEAAGSALHGAATSSTPAAAPAGSGGLLGGALVKGLL